MHILLFKGVDECCDLNEEDQLNNQSIKDGKNLDTDIISDDSNEDKQITFKEYSQKEFQ